MNETIVAPATNLNKQAIAIIRISGPETYNIINKILDKPIKNNSKNVNYRWIISEKEKIDEVIIINYVKPKSFTGEDLIEINCHGGPINVTRIIKLIIKNGARMAEKGEFSRIAFINGKINLIQANSINDLVNANSLGSNKIAVKNLDKNTFNVLKTFKKDLLDIIAKIEINIDYPEYDLIDYIHSTSIKDFVNKNLQIFQNIIKYSNLANKLNEGIKTIIIGKPNVGKSSLLNSLLNEDKAIVSNIPGTTRDLVEGLLHFENFTLKLIDTAGIRNDSIDKIEKIGIKKSLDKIVEADLILAVFSLDDFSTKEDKKILDIVKDKNHIIVYNKKDILKEENKNFINKNNKCFISAKNNNIDELKEQIMSKFETKKIYEKDSLIVSNILQLSLIEKIENNLKKIYNENENKVPVDILSVMLKEIWDDINIFFGETLNETLIDAMFKNYCLGK
ncbi:tRNA uridine-5-carboxymethylaminomethyl(34) synthesis GTPase MnmE [Spiroplasma endosymbiont of Amphibalanus improvisus]|uniref:tRNA uridine-5-carboxymethylaminomethyl(34) synthesis GTPase MnmE n=1 Tax=Spiroplasma endosymbiont of Amphibalanus improvisus TaxID=3066327 RepID=UPI00313A94C8